MKKIFSTFLAATIALAFAACSESENFDPYKNRSKRPFYPTTVSFANLNNDGSQIGKEWKLTYNSDNSIKAYTYDYSVKASSGVVMNEQHSGELSYYKDPSTGNDVIQNILTLNSNVISLASTESYCDKITEYVELSNGAIQKIKTLGQRTYSNGEQEAYSTTRTFTYSDKYCIGSTLIDNSGTTTYKYNWSNGKLSSIVKYQQDHGNNVIQEEYKYTYDNRELATDYEFNTMAFVYGNMPEIYAAMNLFGATAAYKIEGESYSGYRNFTGTSKPIAPVNRNYTIMETTNSVAYTADSQSSSTYIYTFSNN